MSSTTIWLRLSRPPSRSSSDLPIIKKKARLRPGFFVAAGKEPTDKVVVPLVTIWQHFFGTIVRRTERVRSVHFPPQTKRSDKWTAGRTAGAGRKFGVSWAGFPKKCRGSGTTAAVYRRRYASPYFHRQWVQVLPKTAHTVSDACQEERPADMPVKASLQRHGVLELRPPAA